MFLSFNRSLPLSDSDEAQTHRSGIAEGDGGGIVRDACAVWTVVTMRALDLQSKVFSTLTSTQSTMGNLRRLHDRITPAPPPEADAPKVCFESPADLDHRLRSVPQALASPTSSLTVESVRAISHPMIITALPERIPGG